MGPTPNTSVPHPDSPAARNFDWHDLENAIRRDDARDVWSSVQGAVDANSLLKIARPLLDQQSFELGLVLGVAGSVKDMAFALGSLLRTLVLAGLYDAAHANAAVAFGPIGILRFEAKAIELVARDALRKAHDERQKLLDELWKAITNLRETLLSAGGNIERSYQAKWDQLLKLRGQKTLRARYEEGKITGEVLVDVIMLILTVVDGIGAAKALSELPELTKLARGIRNLARAGAKEETEAVSSATRLRSVAESRSKPPRLVAEQTPEAPERLGVARSISHADAEGMLVEQGLSPARAKDFVNSFEGPITARPVKPHEKFFRYTDVADSKGGFLTKEAFSSPEEAASKLYLGPYGNQANLRQPVVATKTSIVLEGAVRGGEPPGTIQTLMVDRTGFSIGPGVPYP
ncbi:MAG: hypothetical protein ACYC9Z_18280 [Casimicrobiaceae bacterium]